MKKLLQFALVAQLAMTVSVAVADNTAHQADRGSGATNISVGHTHCNHHVGCRHSCPTPRRGTLSKGRFHQSLMGQDFTNQNLNFSNFSRQDISGAKFKEAIMEESNFSRVYAFNTDFTGANMMGSDLRYSNFSGANFSNADFRATRYNGANFEGAKYNKNTVFPRTFIPEDQGMIQVP